MWKTSIVNISPANSIYLFKQRLRQAHDVPTENVKKKKEEKEHENHSKK